jgi:hypothetical protein
MTSISHGQAQRVTRLVIGCMLLLLVVIAFVAYSSYASRLDLVDAQRAGCERTKIDRVANAEGWRTAQTARMSTVAKEMGISVDEVKKLLDAKPKPGDLPDLVAARRYNKVASDLEGRSKLDCKVAFP